MVTERLFIESEDEADLSPEGATCMDRMETESPTLVKQDTGKIFIFVIYYNLFRTCLNPADKKFTYIYI